MENKGRSILKSFLLFVLLFFLIVVLSVGIIAQYNNSLGIISFAVLSVCLIIIFIRKIWAISTISRENRDSTKQSKVKNSKRVTKDLNVIDVKFVQENADSKKIVKNLQSKEEREARLNEFKRLDFKRKLLEKDFPKYWEQQFESLIHKNRDKWEEYKSAYRAHYSIEENKFIPDEDYTHLFIKGGVQRIAYAFKCERTGSDTNPNISFTNAILSIEKIFRICRNTSLNNHQDSFSKIPSNPISSAW